MKLLADIGGTNARFSLLSASGACTEPVSLKCADFPNITEAIDAYLHSVGPVKTDGAAICVAEPVMGDAIQLTNSHWHFSRQALQTRFNWSVLKVINDFQAIALSLPMLGQADVLPIGAGVANPQGTKTVIGPGTGLGVASLVWHMDRWVPVSGEGGHVTLSAFDDRESAILAFARGQVKHVSAERLVSGIGLPLLYDAVCHVDGYPTNRLTPQEIAQRAAEDKDPACCATIEAFTDFLAGTAGNLALTVGATGGVYLGGGIIKKLGSHFSVERFRKRFEQKGRFEEYLRPIPVYLILTDHPAMLGLATLLA